MKTLLPFQEEVVPLMATRNFLLADDCGLGKTFCAIEAARRCSDGPNLVVCPRSVKAWWAQEIVGQGAGTPHVCKQAGRDVAYQDLEKGDWAIVHPEALRMAEDAIKEMPWDWVIVDEAHRFKNRKAKQTIALQNIRCNRKIAMTATPYGRNPADMWALLHWLYPKRFSSYWRFFKQHVDYYEVRTEKAKFKKVRGPKNLKWLSRKIAPFYVRRTKTQAGLQLPPLTYVDMPVMIGGRQEATYREIAKESYEIVAGKEVVVENALVMLMRLQQCALDPALMVDTEFVFPEGYVPAKVQWLIEWLDDHPDEPVVIASRYRRFVEDWLSGLSEDAMIVGGMSEDEVDRALQTFKQTGRLVGSMQALAEGLNLQRAATIIVTDGTWSPVQEYQLSQRIHRIGQTQPCQVIHLVGRLEAAQRFTVDVLIRRTLERRVSEAALVDMFVKEVQDAGYYRDAAERHDVHG